MYLSRKDLSMPQNCITNILDKALYCLKQVPRAYYDHLSTVPINVSCKGKIDPTIFIMKQSKDIILVQIYVDDIIFGSINPQLRTN